MKRLRDRYWPKVADAQSAREVARRAASWAMIIAVVTAVLAVLELFGIPMISGVDRWALLDAALWGALASGIWRMSRVAAVVGLVAIVATHVLFPNREVGMAYLIASLLLALAFLNAVRATFAYHRLHEPSATQAFAPKPLEPR